MAIKQNRDDLPRSAGPNAPLPVGQTVIAGPLMETWWAEYQAGPYFKRKKAIEDLPLRASMMGDRCDRQLWYDITETEQSDPPGLSNVWRMRMGQLIGEEIAKALAANELDDKGQRHGWWSEAEVDLRPAGYPGSAHGDLVYYDHGIPVYVGENKSIGGFQFKAKATTFKGEPEGASWSHVMQAALVALVIGAPTIVVFYIAPEAVGADVAKRNNMTEIERICAEWQFPLDLYRQDLQREINRQLRILKMTMPDDMGMAWLPERILDDPSIPAGAMVDNPDKAHWVTLSAADGSVVKSGTKWFCDYCHWRGRCIEDGSDMQLVSLGKKSTSRLNDKLVDEGRS